MGIRIVICCDECLFLSEKFFIVILVAENSEF